MKNVKTMTREEVIYGIVEGFREWLIEQNDEELPLQRSQYYQGGLCEEEGEDDVRFVWTCWARDYCPGPCHCR